ncbi:short chain dehydrogenase [Schizosaccharomyces cryophilus OY26]|uniref:Short chain dehydrogenase n=1 Tax=Schizosaccharomyces cryophilus (strain OY26 / ATCC MYA-4695 / CBS 11777 / NBRC 106824 / NRRL Y48691) TaxID=653667 RepID=S9XAU4_SCHCR|nr:short chain dehydrogenase [Schizosaccharomyces cryophilus OY26]EPY50851.1 short chain dehydrogenase [Schizosaccharomyces cryophilus OY26]
MSPPAKNINERTVVDLLSLKGKKALLYGCSKGIGLDVAEAYAEAGASVVITYNRTNAEDQAKKIAQRHGVEAVALKCNVSDSNDIKSVFDQALKKFGHIDIVVANAGVCTNKSAAEMTPDEFAKEININLNGIFNIGHVTGPVFEKQGFGSFIATASMSGTIANVPQKQCAYNASKAGVIHLCKSLAVEWAPFARVNCVSPGYISTDMTGGMHDEWVPYVPFRRIGYPKELTGAYVFLASDAASYVSGLDLIVDGGYTAI